MPAILLFDVAGSAGAVELGHRAAICVKVGVTRGSTVMSIVTVVAHCPVSGVNV